MDDHRAGALRGAFLPWWIEELRTAPHIRELLDALAA